MKKHIRSCFLASLCLYGSTLLAQVSDSPGADFLHKSSPTISYGLGDTHRGGETHSDTLPENSGLVDHSGQGQKGKSSSVQPEGMLYLEIASPNPSDTLWVTFWEHLINERLTVTPGITLPVIRSPGDFLDRSSHNAVYEITFPASFKDGFFSIRKGSQTLVRHWYFSSADRARVRFDLNSGKVLFGGPASAFYRTQHELDVLFAEESYNRNPVMVTRSRESLFQDSSSKARYQKVLNRPDDIHTGMDILVPGENGWDYLRPILEREPSSHPAWDLLEEKSAELTEWQLFSLSARLTGQLLYAGVQKAEFAESELKQDPDKTQQYLDWIRGFTLEKQVFTHPRLVDACLRNASLKSRLEGTSFFAQAEKYGSGIKDEVIAFYVLDNFNRLGERLPEVLEMSLSRLTTPWISARISELTAMQGKVLRGDLLWDMDGKTVDLRDFRDKTLLIHFWISGCKFCIHEYTTVLNGLAEKYRSDPDILVISVNVGDSPEKWKQSIASGRYTSASMLNLRADKDKGFTEHYRIYSFPQKMIVAPGSKVLLQTINRMEAEQLSLKLEQISADYPNPDHTTQAPHL
ncbi:TlpA family protein disulfide reductase [Algoriphagus resistens]|uniref:TlpA family protein disulfide reductase n=1 Tax=Algoriphagus resistens TaxID=1750590 RepID=UPI000716BEF7|nr:TlpA disulfide reductase family protein [Algoriphagus resistens]